jgi:hypothetical protein
MTKNWTITSAGALGTAIPGTRAQYDEIVLGSIGKLSPWTETSNEKSTLSAPDGTHQIVAISANGHADGNWSGELKANMAAGTKTQAKTVDFSGQDINVSLDCEQNNDVACSTSGVTGTGTNFSAAEGQSFSGQTGTFSDPNTTESGFTASIDWGDGSSSAGTVSGGSGSFAVNGTHTYADEGTYTVTTTLQKGSTTAGTAQSTATVSDAPLTASGKTLVTGSATFSGAVASFTDGNAAAPASDFTASINWGDGSSSAGAIASNGSGFNVSGSHTYSSVGSYTITTTINDKGGSSATATSTLQGYSYVSGGSFTIGDGSAAVGTNVTWWGSQWSTANTLSGGTAPSAFKGFENSATNPTCGTNWTSSGGNSPPPSSSVPQYMATIVTGKVTSSSNTKFNGNTVKMVVVKTNAGYNPNTGSAGTGTVVAVIPC